MRPLANGERPLPKDIQNLFRDLVPAYDRFNQLSSLGLDRRWREALVKMIPDGSRVLDVGTGTGDTALLARRKGARVIGTDLSMAMIQMAKKKAAQEFPCWDVADAGHLPFQNASFDAVTSSFVLRNLFRLGSLAASFEEAYRVLKKGGSMVSLDLTRPRRRILEWGHRLYLKTALPLIGKSLFGRKWPRRYLETSIQEFPEPEEITQLLSRTGFENVRFHPLTGGIAGIFSALKP